ncbi:hypothetical protein Psi02_10580 [Planotetraspora silvatica]|uniref:Uncharacterized protein n=1 Tax=Planotetraspora silvatica TaxID=234614 RepID=A0A8J3UFI5_9ACTN|nr:hypothetical protein Psi02_10580 [Planotetraspora silvatica]
MTEDGSTSLTQDDSGSAIGSSHGFRRETGPLTGCVWESPPILHERDARMRHMLTPELPDLDAYLADSLPEGTTGDRS